MELFCNSECDDRFIKFAFINTYILGCNIIEELDIIFKVSKDEWGNESLNICQLINNDKNEKETITFAMFYNHYNYTQGLKELILNKELHKFFRIKNCFKNLPENKVKLSINILIDKEYLLNMYENSSVPNLIYKIIIDNSIKILSGRHTINKKMHLTLKNILEQGNIQIPPIYQTNKNFKKKLFPHQEKNINWMIEFESKISKNLFNISYYNFENFNIAKYNIESINEDLYLDFSSKQMYNIKNTPISSLNFYGGILSDEVGLGKTFSMIGLISSDSSINNTTLVFTPRRICKQWLEEINSTCNLKCLIIYSIKQLRNLTKKNIKEYDVVIVPYSLIDNKNHKQAILNKEKIFMINKYNWHRVILDESHEIINSFNYVSTNRIRLYLNSIKSKFRWLCSGTPFHSNNYDDITNIMQYLLTKSVSKKCNRIKYEKFKLEKDLLKTFYIWEEILKIICRRNLKNKLHNIEIPQPIVNTEYLEQSPIEKVIYDSALGDKEKMIELCNHILVSEKHIKILGNEPLPLKEIHSKMIKYYSDKKKKIDKRIDNLNNEIKKYKSRKYKSSAEKMLINTFVQDFEDKINLNEKNLSIIDSKYKIFNSLSENLVINNKCPICFEKLDNLTKVITLCGHYFCSRCLFETFKNSERKKCPICRENIIEKQLEIVLPDNIQDNQEKWGTKMNRLIEYVKTVLDKSNSNRIIIFSQFNNMLLLVSKVLKDSGINYLTLNGSFNVINGRIRKFKLNNKIRVILLSSEKAASGLNLTEANNIILLDTHNAENGLCPLIEEQAIGRSVRIGQKSEVIVKRFVMKNTIEEENFRKNVKII